MQDPPPQLRPLRFIGQQVEAQFDRPPTLIKKPGRPDRFVWREQTYRIVETLSEWQDFTRRGRMAGNMRPERITVASNRGSWGVGRDYFRVRTEDGRVFELYYDRAPKSAGDRQGSWFLYREMAS